MNCQATRPEREPRVIAQVSRHTNVPIIAGGLIQTPLDVEKILASGAIAVSTSRSELWPLLPDPAARAAAGKK